MRRKRTGPQKNRQGSDRKASSGRLRIVAGKWRSRLLPIADVAGLRPTPERIRETLFNWLAPSVEGKRCLDLFAGSGALGFEALSRGAGSVVFVERSKVAVRALRENIERLAAENVVVYEGDAVEFLGEESQATIDIIFLDPPFADDLLEDLCRLVEKSGILSPGARIYLEQHRDQTAPRLPDGWSILKEKTAGNVCYRLATIQRS